MQRPIHCPFCGFNGIGNIILPGSLMMEGLLWLLVLPGLMYSIWRRSRKKVMCPRCNSEFYLPMFYKMRIGKNIIR